MTHGYEFFDYDYFDLDFGDFFDFGDVEEGELEGIDEQWDELDWQGWF